MAQPMKNFQLHSHKRDANENCLDTASFMPGIFLVRRWGSGHFPFLHIWMWVNDCCGDQLGSICLGTSISHLHLTDVSVDVWDDVCTRWFAEVFLISDDCKQLGCPNVRPAKWNLVYSLSSCEKRTKTLSVRLHEAIIEWGKHGTEQCGARYVQEATFACVLWGDSGMIHKLTTAV